MEVEVIKAKEKNNHRVNPRKVERMRVAAYCRVSTDDEDQIKSYNSMVRYYTDMIKNNKDWIYAGVYADKAMTGTKDNREQFQKLIQDCKDGKIDMVLAKSLPRFARNTLDTLKYEKELTQSRARLEYYEKQSEQEYNLRKRLNEFRKILQKNEVLEEFDRSVFESVIEKVIIGGYDKDGNAVPYKITFIYKTGFKDEFDNAQKRFGKRKTAKDAVEKLSSSANKMCSNARDKLEALYSESGLDTCGDGGWTTTQKYVEILEFTHFTEFWTFHEVGVNHKEKVQVRKVEVSVVLDLDT